jgi:hypothetical protein
MMQTPDLRQKQDITDYLLTNRVELRELSKGELTDVCSQWLRRFARQVKRQEGTSIYRGFKWHGFSYGIEPCLSGTGALEAFRQTKGRFYLFDESESYGYFCRTTFPFRPDLSEFRADLYLAGTDFSWTMLFTHEQPHIGPFFAEPNDPPNDGPATSVGNSEASGWGRHR